MTEPPLRSSASRVLLGAFALIGSAIMFGLTLFFAMPPLVQAVGAALGIPSAFAASLILPYMILRLTSTAREPGFVDVDEGGVRWRAGRRRGYLRFGEIKDVRAAGTLLAPKLRFETARSTVTAPEGLLPTAQTIRAVYGARTTVPETYAELARRDRPLDEWLSDLQTRAFAPDAYRTAGAASLAAIASDQGIDADIRAAAAFIACTSDEHAAERIAKTLHAASPPMLVVATAIATPGRVEEKLLKVAYGSLDPIDEGIALTWRANPRMRIAEPAPRIEEEEFLEDEEEPARARSRSQYR